MTLNLTLKEYPNASWLSAYGVDRAPSLMGERLTPNKEMKRTSQFVTSFACAKGVPNHSAAYLGR
jgi:hypothetical protein